jgi:copper(I)-binding protein
VKRLFSRNNVVRVFRSDSRTSFRIHDCAMNEGVNSMRQQNPFVVCQLLEHDVFLLGSR